MNTIFIKLFFSTVSLFFLTYTISYSKFEILTQKNTLGGVFIILFSLISIIFVNIIFWIN